MKTKNISRIENFVVFCITASFSLFAYIWLVLVLTVFSPNRVEVWEAVLTFLFFPLLVVIAYAGDKGYFNKLFCQKKAKEQPEEKQLELGESEIIGAGNFVLSVLFQTKPCWRRTSSEDLYRTLGSSILTSSDC